MEESLDELYFNWLCAKVVDNSFGRELMVILFQTEFVWTIPADRHRAEDGLELRQDFLRETRSRTDIEWEEQPCSVFEMFIAFAKRCEFQTDMPVKEWFWIFLTNLGLDEIQVQSPISVERANHILQNFIWRTYEPKGLGGMFPMNNTRKDQRAIEIWYQWCEFVDEYGLI